MTAEYPYRNGLSRRLARWLRRIWMRSRPDEMMIEPDPALLSAWRTLLGVKGRD